ncbi:hypothetical protein TTHERM_000628389 (macronuclear) [Tetrahymena thermophila SB210]|uniref:Uncharacterized protein n=1 Tax=Tetrahymena thermophila (strain SB210) TaxID=312017 RepID=W7XIQ7_TETTS|nr:hypothetical protein TTHERM_000628389 [Tetrahymena thermophila SB210]EWS73529.1 hypothetical protein TTHERM_000628389 [Tetrahymena thermophila SB210]|eukprot:XP_012653919.1 hypothetical protein TTHERM_000628389 [Tetrahymena thermophila SB210]
MAKIQFNFLQIKIKKHVINQLNALEIYCKNIFGWHSISKQRGVNLFWLMNIYLFSVFNNQSDEIVLCKILFEGNFNYKTIWLYLQNRSQYNYFYQLIKIYACIQIILQSII